jgi:succinate dehydrogenase / fumarate reductase cytochrome b subunit
MMSSSLGRKYIMGATGLLLCGFLVVHMAGNLLLYVGPEAYNRYAHTLHRQEWLVKVAETGLLVLLLLHLYLAVTLTLNNRDARGRGYALKRHKDGAENSFAAASGWMMISGLIVLVFLVWHLWDFTFQLGADDFYEMPDGTEREPFDKAVLILTNPLTIAVYIVGCLVLAVHVSHGFSSAFRSLGVSHPKYNKCIRVFGYLFAVLFAAGFASFPVWAYFTYGAQ